MTAPLAITIERLEGAITVTMQAMVLHNLRELSPILKRLEAERDRVLTDGDPIEHARRVLAARAAVSPKMYDIAYNTVGHSR
jgi:hypothetical protein